MEAEENGTAESCASSSPSTATETFVKPKGRQERFSLQESANWSCSLKFKIINYPFIPPFNDIPFIILSLKKANKINTGNIINIPNAACSLGLVMDGSTPPVDWYL
jgi:hypothetical protein